MMTCPATPHERDLSRRSSRSERRRRVFMLKRTCLVAAIVAGLCVSLPAQSPRKVRAGDWPELRGPNRDGISVEKGLISTWKLNGENFLWRVPGGGRSTPIVMGN